MNFCGWNHKTRARENGYQSGFDANKVTNQTILMNLCVFLPLSLYSRDSFQTAIESLLLIWFQYNHDMNIEIIHTHTKYNIAQVLIVTYDLRRQINRLLQPTAHPKH